MLLELVRHKFTVEQYHQMAANGILAPSDRLELINGEIIEMSPIGIRHASCVRRAINLLAKKLGDFAIIDAQDPIKLSDSSEPQPDIAVLNPRSDFYATAHPEPQDVFLLIEVADTTIASDREVKVPLYARSSISELWLIDLNNQILEVYYEPIGDRYRYMQLFEAGQSIHLQAFPSISFAVNDIL
ncbi:Uma2 family endonuclease [Tumidithrix elongata RA019]|uniref:Uma2 family endonuclease n=1 Tax=Tumidithrix elongata BACA0141 TaxID=2716417 RepID=A0AAW9PVK0_9CYAN|nr:Uma2 family endonuclease [Tumidithrix elongata RA019]